MQDNMLRWVTCANLPEPDHDEVLFFSAAKERNIPVSLLRWDDPADSPNPNDIALVRSTWNYPWQFAQFKEWIKTCGETCRLVNPASVLLTNIDKRYLLDLSVPIVPTEIFSKQESIRFPNERFILKPTIGAGSYRTRVFEAPCEEAEAFAASICEDCDVMVQPFIASVATKGEQSFVFIDGEFTHKIIKMPRFEGDHESVSDGLPLEARDLRIAEQAIQAVRDSLVYARVDVMEIEGEWVVSEIELTEPSLFLKQFPPALNRLLDWAERNL